MSEHSVTHQEQNAPSVNNTSARQNSRRIYRGYGWSRKGTKASRRNHRQKKRRFTYYAVAVGHRPGIYDLWEHAKAQVTGFRDAVYKGFNNLVEAQKFMAENRQCPPSIRTPFNMAHRTPLPPDEWVYLTDEPDVYVQVAPKYVCQSRFADVVSLSHRIAENKANCILDPSDCTCPSCPYSTGDFRLQRYMLLQRFYQLNATLVHGA